MTTENHSHDAKSPSPASIEAQVQDQVQAQVQAQVLDEVSAVKNFSFIGALVAAAGLLFLFAWDTSSIPLEHSMRPAPNLAKIEKTKVAAERTKKNREFNGAHDALLESTLDSLRAQIALHDLGVKVEGANGEVLVTGVLAASPAEKAGLRTGSKVLRVNGSSIATVAEFVRGLRDVVSGQSLSLELSSGSLSIPVAEPTDVAVLCHELESYASLVEGICREHSSREAEIYRNYKNRKHELDLVKAADERLPEDRRLKVDFSDASGAVRQVFKAEKDLGDLQASYEAGKAARLSQRDARIYGASSKLRVHAQEHQALFATLIPTEWPSDASQQLSLGLKAEKMAACFLKSWIELVASYYDSLETEAIDLEFRIRNDIPADQRVENKRYEVYAAFMKGKLKDTFGTPQAPIMKDFEGPQDQLLNGERLYFRHCQHCHGTSGYGDGPTSQFLNPKPRVFTRGVFKFRSNPSPKPSTEDLLHVLKHGLDGSLMPNFKLYGETNLRALVQYVRYLAARGEVEHKVYTMAVEARQLVIDDPDENPAEALKEWFDEFKTAVYGEWTAAESNKIEVGGERIPAANMPEKSRADDEEGWAAYDKYQGSLARGEAVFNIQCARCHGFDGTGGGAESDGMVDDWGDPIKPRNLTRGIYRAGSRPIDIYYRVSVGIAGAGMPAFEIPDEDKWAVVNYVLKMGETAD